MRWMDGRRGVVLMLMLIKCYETCGGRAKLTVMMLRWMDG